MAINSYFFNALYDSDTSTYDRTYNAEDVTSYLDLLVGNGVFPNPSTQLQVRAGSGMNVIVGAGSGWINGHKLVNTAALTLSIAASDVVYGRKDLVIFYVDYSTRSMGIEIKQGTASSDADKPNLTRSSTRYEMCLAVISVPKQTTAITTALIEDTRGNSNVCGYVQGLIQQIDSSTLWERQEAQFNDWFEGVQTQFQQGKQFVKLEGVATSTAGQSTFNVLTYVPTYSFAYDILDVYINGIHLNGNEYTLSNNTITLETPISRAGQVVTFVVYKSVDPDA